MTAAKPILALLLATAGLCTAQSADPVQNAVLKTQTDIERDTQALIELRAEIDRDRKPLAERLEALQSDVAELRAEADRTRTVQRQSEQQQADLIAEAKSVEEECRFLLAMFSEYARSMGTRAGAADAPRLEEQLAALELNEVETGDFAKLSEAVDQLLAVSEQWNSERVGGCRFPGAAVDAEGIEHRGTFALFGPTAYFADDTMAGLAITRSGIAQPSVFSEIPPEAVEAIRALVKGSETSVPLDVTAGDAIRIKEAKSSLFEQIKKGGFVMIPLLAVGFVALILSIWKAIELARIRIGNSAEARLAMEKVRAGQLDEARQLAQTIKEPLAALVSEAIEHRDSPREHLEEILHERVLGSLPRLERNLGTLAVLGGVAPLLGLLGTVTGMIHTFQLVTIFGSGDAKLLSGGISEALATTEFGLAIAIPVLLVHAFLARRARTILGALERAAVAMINDLKTRAEKP